MSYAYNRPRRPKQESWIHPIHGKGIRSPSLASSHVGKALTDKKILEYKRRGFYGEFQPFEDPGFLAIWRDETLTMEQREWKLRLYMRNKNKIK